MLLMGCMKSLMPSAEAGNSGENMSLPLTSQTVGPNCALPLYLSLATPLHNN